MLVGIRPTIGRISRYGVIPITADHDTAGPMTRTVTDAAVMMGALESPAPDQQDEATRTCTPPPGRDYTKFLQRDALKGARIGIPRAFYFSPITIASESRPRGGLNPEQLKVMSEAIEILKQQGAIVTDPADVPSFADKDPNNNFSAWDFCSGAEHAKGKDSGCSINFKYGMKRDFNAYLASLGPGAPFKTLTQLREYNLANRPRNTLRYGQEHLDISDEMDVTADRARYEADRAKDIFLSRTHGIDEVIARLQLDALLFPGSGSAAIAAKAGEPTVIVPFGFVPNAPAGLPAGFNPKDQPYGVGFTGTLCSEGRLIELAYAFEQATKRRVPPPLP
jgi:amidase